VWIISAFLKDGVPAVGLAPVITIRLIETDELVISNAPMFNHASGMYKYYFTNYNRNRDYSFFVDGGSSLSDVDRYRYATNEDTRDTTSQLTLIENGIYDALGLMNENTKFVNLEYDSNGCNTYLLVNQYTDNTLTEIRKQWEMISVYNVDGELISFQLIEINSTITLKVSVDIEGSITMSFDASVFITGLFSNYVASVVTA
jgi:hypothetical protein